jgi:prepilin-type N-terminal cleavage/methylation domain-containing protein
MRRERKQSGLSLVEVLVVVAILAILASVAYAIMGPVKKGLATGTCSNNMRLLHNALMVYRADWGNAQSDVGDVPRLGLPPGLYSPATAKPYFGEEEWFVCPAPKNVEYQFKPHYKAFFWLNEFMGSTFDPPYEEVTAKYKGKTPIIFDPNHIDHATTHLEQPRTKKFVIFVNLGGKVVTKTVQSRFNHPRDVGFFELD